MKKKEGKDEDDHDDEYEHEEKEKEICSFSSSFDLKVQNLPHASSC